MHLSAVSSSGSGFMAHPNAGISPSKTNSIVQIFMHHSWLSSLAIGATATAIAMPTLGFTAGIALGAGAAALSKLAITYLFSNAKASQAGDGVAATLQQNQTITVAFSALSSRSDSEKGLTLQPISSQSTSSASPSSSSSSSSSIANSRLMTLEYSASMPPIGISRSGMNCWANALFQLIINSPSYTDSLKKYPQLSKSGVSLAQMADQYRAEQKNPASRISSIDTQNFREILNTIAQHVVSEESSQPQDPYMIFSCLKLGAISAQSVTSRESSTLPTHNQSSGSVSTAIQLGENHTQTTIQTEQIQALFLRKINSTDNLETLLDNFFERQLLGASNSSSSGKHSTYKTTKIEIPPQDLTIALQGQTDVIVPRALRLEKTKHTLNENADYILDSFILGVEFLGTRHYIAYVRKSGFWFKCNDDSVCQINEGAALNAAKKAYMLHFSKIN